jgi:RNA polymerase sigma factor (sigma-70 family)
MILVSDRPPPCTLLGGMVNATKGDEMTDLELLAEYTRTRSDEAFALIVERYIRLVHSACWRQMGDAQLAEDATQLVFVLLSKKAAKLRHAELAGWLLTTAHYTCANMKRAEARRVRREQVAAMNSADVLVQPHGELLQMLDEGLLRMAEDDRAALAARFLRGEPLRQVGELLGLSEDAARKRVERGLAKLRRFFQERGVTTDSVALAAVMADHSLVPPIAGNLTPRILHAAKVGPGAAVMRPELVAAGTVAVAALLGVFGWGIFKWATQQQVAAPVAAVAAAAAPAPAAEPPATLPASDVATLDRSTPDATLASLCRALNAADQTGVTWCLLPNFNRPKTLVEASGDKGLAQRRLILAAEKTFGPDGGTLFEGDLPLATVLQSMILLRRLQGETANITGNTATISTEIPPAIIQSVPADAQQILLSWSGKPIYFELHDGAWLIDMDRSIRFVIRVQKRNNGPLVRLSDAAGISFLEEQVANYDAVTQKVEQGQLTNLDDVRQALRTAQDQMDKRLGYFGIQNYAAPALPSVK